MGLISKLLSYARIANRNGAAVSDVKHDPGGGENQTGEHFQPANTDSVPLPGDYLVTVSVQRTGGEVVVGFIDPKQQQNAQQGEHRTYARNAEGEQVVELHLKSDGSAVLHNADGSVLLNADGSIVLTTPHGVNTLATDGSVAFSNGASINTAGDVLTAAGISLDKHVHVGNLGANTSVPVP